MVQILVKLPPISLSVHIYLGENYLFYPFALQKQFTFFYHYIGKFEILELFISHYILNKIL